MITFLLEAIILLQNIPFKTIFIIIYLNDFEQRDLQEVYYLFFNLYNFVLINLAKQIFVAPILFN